MVELAGDRPVHAVWVNEDGGMTFLLTSPIDGENAVSERWLSDPGSAVTAIGTGLRRLHDALPVQECPFSWMTDVRLARVREAHRAGALGARPNTHVRANLPIWPAWGHRGRPPGASHSRCMASRRFVRSAVARS